MPVSELSALERIARVLAGQRLSSNAKGADPSAGEEVDARWPEFRDVALAVLRTLREPDHTMADAGDAELWRRMVDAALVEYGGAA
jgi:hypothetical protein